LLTVIESLTLKLKKMKKILVLASALIFAASVTGFGQTQKPAEKKEPPKSTTSTVKQEPAKTNTPATQQAAKTEQKTLIAVNQLPKTAQDYLTKTYPGKNVDQATKITEANGNVAYMAELGTMMVYFDATGKFMKETKNAATEVKPAAAPVKTQPAPAPKKEAAAPAKK
jgi:hypothetical protein